MNRRELACTIAIDVLVWVVIVAGVILIWRQL